jgi:hypothetical protein
MGGHRAGTTLFGVVVPRVEVHVEGGELGAVLESGVLTHGTFGHSGGEPPDHPGGAQTSQRDVEPGELAERDGDPLAVVAGVVVGAGDEQPVAHVACGVVEVVSPRVEHRDRPVRQSGADHVDVDVAVVVAGDVVAPHDTQVGGREARAESPTDGGL